MSRPWSRVALIALASCLFVPVALAERHKSLSDCTSFEQNDKGDTSVEMTIHNSCSIQVDCTVQWRVVCSPDAKTKKSVHPASSKLSITEGTSSTAEASAAVCGDAAFAIDSVEWVCTPNND